MWIAIFVVLALMALGAVLPFWLPQEQRDVPLALAAAAGVMLATALCHLLPEAVEDLGHAAGVAALSGFVAMYVFERFLTVHICETFGCAVHHIGLSALFGLSLHTFANGVALGAGVLEGLGGVVFLAIAAHKVPETFSLTAILQHEGYARKQIALLTMLLMSMIPLGAIAVMGVAQLTSWPVVPYATAFSSGTFVHVAVSDLLPEVHKRTSRKTLVLASFLIGILGVLVFIRLPHQG